MQRWRFCTEVMRPSRRPLRGLLRMTNFLNDIEYLVMLRSARRARLEARTTADAANPIS